jgi:hypothetical protein
LSENTDRPTIEPAVVCRPVCSIRSRPNIGSELVTQELFGRSVGLLRIRSDWAGCLLSDGYRGWLPLGSVSRASSYRPSHIVIRRFAPVVRGGTTVLLLPLGSLVEQVGAHGDEISVGLLDGGSGRVGRMYLRRLRSLPVKRGRLGSLVTEVMGTPYVWGGKSTFGFDCSGLVQSLFDLLGRALPRDSADQASEGRQVRSLAGLRPLDLVFFGRDRIDHVALHLGGLDILHASGYVRVESLNEASHSFRPDLCERFRFGRRVIDASS